MQQQYAFFQEIVEYLRAISEGRKPRGGSPIDGKISINELHKIEADEFDKAIKLKVWEKVAFQNWRDFKEVKKYINEKKLLLFLFSSIVGFLF